jgi:uncharacterized protein YecT (DUF1311 family)
MSNTFTVEKKGQEIVFDSLFSDIEDAKTHLNECLSYNTFAMNLISRNKLSQKQIAWIHYLASENVKEMDQKQNESGEFLPLVQKMYSAVKTKTRKFKLRLPGVDISTIPNGVNAGGLYTFVKDSYVGKITDTGVLKANVDEDVMNLLLDANDNLLQLAKIYGHETGNCSVCGRTLSDPLSVQMGIGPICAKRFG